MSNLELEQLRYSSDSDSTLSTLHNIVNFRPEFLCYLLEDEYREVKVPGETRIPAGRYEIKLRTEGGMHGRYKDKYPWHKGMLWLQDVPNFTWIYIHPGVTDDHSEGCLLTGDGQRQNKTKAGKNYDTMDAYQRIYELISKAILDGRKVFITIKDYA